MVKSLFLRLNPYVWLNSARYIGMQSPRIHGSSNAKPIELPFNWHNVARIGFVQGGAPQL
jgi:hypothetical protein